MAPSIPALAFEGGECAGLFYPDRASNPIEGRNLDYHWDGARVDLVRDSDSLLLGMSVPNVSGKAIANLEVESLKHVAPTFHGDTIYGETTVLAKWPSTSKSDRGIVQVETRGYNQDGTLVCVFRRKVMVPTETYIKERGGEQPGRPSQPPERITTSRTQGAPWNASRRPRA